MAQGRMKNSIYNAIAIIVYTLTVSILSLISTNFIIAKYGSDFNGVVATAGQLVNLLLIVEGGFSVAITVALYKPYVNNQTEELSSILSGAKKIFTKIGLLFLLGGTIVSLVYPFIIKSDLDFLVVFLIILMVIIATSFHLCFINTRQIMFQVIQKEYLYIRYQILLNIVSGILVILLVWMKTDMLIVRGTVLLFSILNGLIVYILYNKMFKEIHLNAMPDISKIKGTNDVMIQKLSNVIYTAFPILFISSQISAKMASVYAVYLSIYNIIRMFITSFVSAPVNAFGQLFNKDKEYLFEKYKLYQFIIIVITSLLISATMSVVVPFVTLYTKTVKDINYIDYTIALLMGAVIAFEVIHLPAGHIINISGNFKIGKKIQTTVCIAMVSLLVVLSFFFDIYGILIAILLSNILALLLEFKYVYNKIFHRSIKDVLLILFSNIVLVILCIIVNNQIGFNIHNYLDFFLTGIRCIFINSGIILVLNVLFFQRESKAIYHLLKHTLMKR